MPIPKPQVLPPRASKYSSIQSKLDTGATAKKMPKVLSTNQFAKRNAELFKRLSPSRLGSLVNQYSHPNQDGGAESVYNLLSGRNDSHSAVVSVVDAAVSVTADQRTEDGLRKPSNLLLVDLRSPDQFAQKRIVSAINHPYYLLTRDSFPKELLDYKAKTKGKGLVVYHEDDRQTAQFATVLIERGWEEVWIVTGGLAEFYECYPELIEEQCDLGKG